ncbi:reductase RutE [Klebsiella variicola]|nr:reductase RutE [Klebsiella variicola]
MNDAINHTACETLFTQARTHNGWLDKPVSDAQLQAIWDLMKMGAHLRQLFASAHRVRPQRGRQREAPPNALQRQSAENHAGAGDRHRGMG